MLYILLHLAIHIYFQAFLAQKEGLALMKSTMQHIVYIKMIVGGYSYDIMKK